MTDLYLNLRKVFQIANVVNLLVCRVHRLRWYWGGMVYTMGEQVSSLLIQIIRRIDLNNFSGGGNSIIIIINPKLVRSCGSRLITIIIKGNNTIPIRVYSDLNRDILNCYCYIIR